MQVSFYKHPSQYELQNDGYVPQNYPTHTISANNHTWKYLDVPKFYSIFGIWYFPQNVLFREEMLS
jgi:hypothetical protein